MVTSSAAILKIKRAIMIAALAMIAIVGGIMILAAMSLLTLPIATTFGIITFVAFGVFRSWYTLKWKLWAYENVDDIFELIARSGSLGILSDVNSRWQVGSASDKARIEAIIDRRAETKTLKVNLSDDHSISHTTTVSGSRKHNLIAFAICIGAAWLPVNRLRLGVSNRIETDYILSAVAILIALHFLHKILEPSAKLTLSNHGLWTRKSGFQKWAAVESIKIENSIKPSGEHLNEVVIDIKREVLSAKERSIKFDIRNLDKSADELEQMIKIYRQRFEATGIPNHTEARQDAHQSQREAKNASKFIFLPGLVLIAVGSYFYYNETISKENCKQVSGIVSYFEDSFGKYRNRDTKFLQLEGQPEVYQLFVGRNSGDFSPEVDKLDSVRKGDRLTIYTREVIGRKNPDEINLNKSVKYIERDSQLIFKDGDQMKYFAVFIIALGLAFVIWTLIRKIKERKIKPKLTRHI